MLALVAIAAGIPHAFAQSSVEAIQRAIEERQAQARAEASRRDMANFVSSSFWDTPAGRRQIARMRREEFQEAMTRFVELGTEPWEVRYDEGRSRVVLADDRQARDLENAVEDISKYIEREYRLQELDLDVAPTGEAADIRILRIQSLMREILPGITDIVGGDLLDAVKFVEVRESLARIRVLSRSFRD